MDIWLVIFMTGDWDHNTVVVSARGSSWAGLCIKCGDNTLTGSQDVVVRAYSWESSRNSFVVNKWREGRGNVSLSLQYWGNRRTNSPTLYEKIESNFFCIFPSDFLSSLLLCAYRSATEDQHCWHCKTNFNDNCLSWNTCTSAWGKS